VFFSTSRFHDYSSFFTSSFEGMGGVGVVALPRWALGARWALGSAVAHLLRTMSALQMLKATRSVGRVASVG